MPQPQMVTGLPSRMDCALLLVTLMVALTGTVTPQTSSEPCPKRLVGEERRRTCPRPCKADLDCGSKRQCLCDGQCGLSCVAPGRTCPWPLAPREDAVARLLHPTHSFSALLEVRCKPGLTLPSGLDVVIRRCQGDRRWSGDEPICTEAVLPEPGSSPPKCPLPKEVTSTFTIEGTATVGTSIRYSCQSGADIVGSAENYCQENQTWQYPHPVCKTRCLIPAVRSRVMIDGVKRWPFDITDTMVPHGENVTFFCKHLHKHCSFSVAQSCFDGELRPPACYLEPTWLQFQLFPHRLVSEIETCDAADVETF
ncbi:beta-2-glycoprotein 1-like isoform X3 [Corythoichthys intestinalis]|uniref:beta-2-glycoprotein 1-like isoform X3 n=1 Tax=Corythoichthys intestinalis TaxID=161448 RepID=UPI0025A64486|nr:beta-2-glycoprotein 1-like isoform X3 [Corythoichthys intestinalis]